MKKDLKPFIKQIKGWLDSDQEQNLSWDNLCPDWLFQSAGSISGVAIEEDMEINGWQLDYFQHFTYKKKRYIMTGSAYYGSASISRSDV